MSYSNNNNYVPHYNRDIESIYKMARLNSTKADAKPYRKKLDKKEIKRIARQFENRTANKLKLSYNDIIVVSLIFNAQLL